MIFGIYEVKDMAEEAMKVQKGGKSGFCGMIVAFQRSSDIDEGDEWMGLINTLKKEIKSYFATHIKQIVSRFDNIDQKIESVKEEMKENQKKMDSKLESV